jgi:Mrp family chromosome partitioning ATPase
MRRSADRERPALLDPQLDAYRMLAWHVSALAPRDGILVLTGDVPAITAAIAANIAAVLANEARATLLLDIDFGQALLADIMGIPAAPGIAAVLENRRRWSETIVHVTTGRGRSVDCIPAGGRTRPLGPAEQEALGAEIRRAARRYDVTIVHAPLELARRAMRGADVMVCASLSQTRLSSLARTAAGLRDDGARILGVALWEGDAVRVRTGGWRMRPSQLLARRRIRMRA